MNMPSPVLKKQYLETYSELSRQMDSFIHEICTQEDFLTVQEAERRFQFFNKAVSEFGKQEVKVNFSPEILSPKLCFLRVLIDLTFNERADVTKDINSAVILACAAQSEESFLGWAEKTIAGSPIGEKIVDRLRQARSLSF
jgi:hypothetical protein